MQVAQQGSVLHQLYNSWQQDLRRLFREQDALRKAPLVLHPDQFDVLTEDVHYAEGRENASKWALATVLHAVQEQERRVLPLDAHHTVVNWTYGCHLADDYHRAVYNQRCRDRERQRALAAARESTSLFAGA